MPKKIVAIDYQLCKPENCKDGVCAAAYACDKKLLKQDAPYEQPEPRASLCQGCARCVVLCPKKAIRVM